MSDNTSHKGLTEQQCWEIIGDNFKTKGFVSHQIDSFNTYINHGIHKIITEEPPIYIEATKENNNIFKSYTITFSDIYIPDPTVLEEDRTVHKLYPLDARNRDLTYDSPIFTTVTTQLLLPDGTLEVKEFPRTIIGRVPIMLRSSKCYLSYMTEEERIKAGECSYDKGGYFIIKGKERVLIPQIRGIYNIPKATILKGHDKFTHMCEVRSMSEETGHSVLVKAMIGNNGRNIVLQMPNIKELIPAGIVFKAFGCETDKEIRDALGLSDKKSNKIIEYIIRDSILCSTWGSVKDFYDQTRENGDNSEEWDSLSSEQKEYWETKSTIHNSLRYIGRFAIHTQKESDRVKYAQQVLYSELFPHMGIAATKKEKLYYLGSILTKLIRTFCGFRPEDDKDDYINKRVESSGVLSHELFRQLFKKYCSSIVSAIEKKKQLPDAISIIPRILSITQSIRQCFGTGNWGVPKNNYVRPGVAQILSRLSYGATLSNLRRVTIPIGKESKNTKIRQIHPSQIMFLCPTETPEGAACGTVLNLSLLTQISERASTVIVKDVIEKCDDLISLEDSTDPELTKVFLNGVLMGVTEQPHNLCFQIRKSRKIGVLPYDVSINYNTVEDEINIFSDEGRLIRPVLTVKDQALEVLPTDDLSWNNLVKTGKIIYLDNNEIGDSVIAFDQNELTKYHNDYCEIAPAMMLGVMANIIPFPEHSPSPRNCYQSSMGKQAMSMFALSHLIRTDTVVHVLSYPQKPLISTKPAQMMGFDDMPSGINVIVAVACYTGFNQEDSVILNQSAIDRGLFWATTYKNHSEEEKKFGTLGVNIIGNPPLDKCRRDVNYSLLDENGIIRKRHPIWTDENGKQHGGGPIYVENGDVIIGKMSIQTLKSGEEEITECSLVIKKGDEGYIDRVLISTTPNGYKLVKVVIRTLRVPEPGDKFASRAAQKGITGITYRQEDMPWTDGGITPDIIMNPHALPSRMTINQLMESVLGKVCAVKGEFGDSTAFTSSSIGMAEEYCKQLGMLNFEETGKEMMYNGLTGERMGMVFIGPVYYQRLKHLVSDKIHARSTGPNATLTRQPLEGRSRDGGLRFGEMERDCQLGTTRISLSNNLSIAIQDMTEPIWDVLGWDAEKEGLVKSKQIAFMDKGKRDCVKLTLEDGRTTECTPDHPLLLESGEWVKAKDIKLNDERVVVGITAPQLKIKEEIEDCNGWTLKLDDIVLKTDTVVEYLRTLAFVRILGYMLFDGHITKDHKGKVFLGHKLDIDSFMDDLKLFCDIPSVNKENHCFRIYLPRQLMKNILKLDGLTLGAKVNQEAKLPSFIFKGCPTPIVREFLGGVFGADGHTCYLGMHRGKRDLLTSIGFSKSKTKPHLESLNEMMKGLKELLARFDINEVTIQKEKEITDSKNKSKREEEERVYEMTLHLSVNELRSFSERIGFRYCCHKSQRLEAGVSYKRLRDEVTRQHNWIVDKVDEMTNYSVLKKEDPKKKINVNKAIKEAVKELEKTEPLLHSYAIPTTHDISDHILKGTKFGKFRSKAFPNAAEFMEQVDAYEWFSSEFEKNFGVSCDSDALPVMHMRVLGRHDIGEQSVYDISVDKTHSFLAEGVVAHNCMIAHGTSRFLKERLCDQSDPYQVWICNACGNFATIHQCKSCKSNEVVKVNMPYVSKLVTQELNAMMIKCKIQSK